MNHVAHLVTVADDKGQPVFKATCSCDDFDMQHQDRRTLKDEILSHYADNGYYPAGDWPPDDDDRRRGRRR